MLPVLLVVVLCIALAFCVWAIVTDPVPPKRRTLPPKLSRGEYECNVVLRELFPRHTFLKVRPPWLAIINHRQRVTRLELDFYCAELNLAVEYNGRQHYVRTPIFHPNGDVDFHRQLAYDHHKAQVCAQRGVDLIVVPFTARDIRAFLSCHACVRRRLVPH